MKKLLAFVLSAAFMLPLAACGGGSNHSDTSAATIKTNEDDTVTMTAEELIDNLLSMVREDETANILPEG